MKGEATATKKAIVQKQYLKAKGDAQAVDGQPFKLKREEALIQLSAYFPNPAAALDASSRDKPCVTNWALFWIEEASW
jgi:hypothetical protein